VADLNKRRVMLAEPTLTAIANKHGTDKGTEGPIDTWHGHNYTDIYEAYLWPMRHQEVRILEIGLGVTGHGWDAQIAQGKNTGGGASAKMWAEYFPKARIFGVDINPASHLDTDRITTFVADQGDPARLREIIATTGLDAFDIVIDDGSHRADHQQIAFRVLFDQLRTGGIYIIEDLLDNGLDDPDSGIFASEIPVLSTRSVFQTLVATGRFGKPNAIGDSTDLAEHINWVHFHAPTRRTALGRGRSLRRPLRAVSRFRPRSEKMCILQRA
jgi:SAM-dependent methyltransferase